MAAVTITPADFQVSSSASPLEYTASEALAIMTPVYLDSNGKATTASNASSAASQCIGFAASKASADGDLVWVLGVDDIEITVGGTLVAGDFYYLGAAGAIIPMTDLATNNWVTTLFYATTTAKAKLCIRPLTIQAV